MIPYYIAFLLSALFCFLGEKSLRANIKEINNNGKEKNRNSRRVRLMRHNFVITIRTKKNIHFALRRYHLFFLFSVIGVSILAWLRDYSVGTDILTYGNDLFRYSLGSTSLMDYIQRFNYIEPLYLALVYFSSVIGNTPHILYLLTGIIIYSFMLASFVRIKQYIPITLSWICFLFLLYGDTFNAMRQSLAIAIGIWSFCFVMENKPIKFFVCLLLAFLFHNTAIFFLGIAGIYWILQKNNKMYIKILLVFAAIGVVVFFNQVLDFFIGVGLFKEKMEKYYISDSTSFSIPAILIRIPFLALIIFQKKQFYEGENASAKIFALKNEAEGDFFLLMLICEMFTVELSSFISSLYRISLYFLPFRCMAYARICFLQKRNTRIILHLSLLVYLLIVFIYQNQIKGNNDIYPYVFYFLD